AFDVVILDLNLPGMNGFDILKSIRTKNTETAVIVITGYPTVETAVKAMKMGANDFIPKPFTPNTLRTIVARALEKRRIETEKNSLKRSLEKLVGIDAIIGKSVVIQELKRYIKKAAISDCSVLITGETGTGKELVARALHYNSGRKKQKFVTVDSGGLVDTLIESELFGHVRGAFTGAHTDRVGRFEMADRGTLFFDEISNMGIRIQSKLLRVLQEQEIAKVGSSQLIPVDVRIIAATNSNMSTEIRNGNFREDLFYRLNVISFYVPPLRERREDIPFLADHFLNKFRIKKGTEYPEKITDDAVESMARYDWPGNVRELENLMEKSVALCDDREVDPFHVADKVAIYSRNLCVPGKSSHQLMDIEKEHIEHMLKIFNNNKSQTAKVLGIDRKTLRNKMRKYGIDSGYFRYGSYS
ncbi:MAG: sigma-54-dependent Fis family transcriptional regulator, partial [Candidatus Latescibacteria bacterium]|nr:sigma-54-dependent Fis family transcriptional regulator [Candidatus Latescibacterota bacterium]